MAAYSAWLTPQCVSKTKGAVRLVRAELGGARDPGRFRPWHGEPGEPSCVACIGSVISFMR